MIYSPLILRYYINYFNWNIINYLFAPVKRYIFFSFLIPNAIAHSNMVLQWLFEFFIAILSFLIGIFQVFSKDIG